MIGAADLHKAIVTLWDDNDLDDSFTNLWADSDVDLFPVLHDSEATPGQPFPYCVFQVSPGFVRTRMTRTVNSQWQTVDVPMQFNIHAKEISGDARTAKRLASDLAAAVMAVYGGHPTEPPQDGELDNGNFLLAQYQNDYGVRTGDEEYLWIVSYVMRLDIPVRVSAVS